MKTTTGKEDYERREQLFPIIYCPNNQRWRAELSSQTWGYLDQKARGRVTQNYTNQWDAIIQNNLDETTQSASLLTCCKKSRIPLAQVLVE